VAVDRPRDPEPQLIVELRDRQDADLVVDSHDALDLAHPLLEIVALERHRHPTGEDDASVVDFRGDAVENGELRVAIDLIRDVVEHLQILAFGCLRVSS
jgi:hypothetical protein